MNYLLFLMSLTILIPSSLTLDTFDKRIKTYKISQIARAAAIFRVAKILIYKDTEYDNSRFISLILRYAETPQYLRKKLFPLRDELRYVGVIPPLRTPHHPTHSKVEQLSIGEVREGFVSKGKIDIGVDELAPFESRYERVTVKVVSKDPLKVERCEPPPQTYWGYETRVVGSLGKTLRKLDSIIVFTSKKGEPLKIPYKDVAFVFGSPHRGVHEILADEGLDPTDFSDLIVNTIPNQGAETIRTEEAIFATLAIYNYE